ncbi:RNA polymerase sigma factor [Plebeiibacterium sediminum]|uniref:Sigma-70 family RNA polymerase sigma factor n=1 Tax=Plebeiibacterium sediminum TaxID=2992112 RepID=A0AAE3M4P4_9BACT|nr:sigma-70 family RNA polymerase sigma factor [Plebeiobacterium sediminum]MCW3786610.1 sigma-70 family RNA polymerase sigma factor [Plebeiobacterium sediminum]
MNNFDHIYKHNYPKLYRVAIKMLLHHDEAKDILQEVFMYYYQKTNSGYKIEYPTSWLYRATLNKCMDLNKCNQKTVSIEDHENNKSMLDENLAERSFQEQVIQKALSALCDSEKELAILYSEGLSYKEMAEITGIKYSSIGKTLSRTLKKLNGILKKMKYEMY